MANMNLLDFFLNTYEGDLLTVTPSKRGRKPNEREPYRPGTGHDKKCRVFRGEGHETMPNFIGDWFPWSDVKELQDIYHASMLALFHPWINIADLKPEGQTFQQAFDTFFEGADSATRDKMSNIQYQYECSDSALAKRQASQQSTMVPLEVGAEEHSDGLAIAVEGSYSEESPVAFTLRDMELGIASEFSSDDKLYAEVAINIAIDCKIFSEVPPKKPTWNRLAKPATNKQLLQFQELAKLVQTVTKNRVVPDKRSDIELLSKGVETISADETAMENVHDLHGDFSHVERLNVEQKMAHDIVVNHLKARIFGRSPKQLLMIIRGQGGTGKSTLLNAITTSFDRLNAPQLLKKTAMSGVAASLIGGTTLHWFAGLPPQSVPQSDVWPDNSSKMIKDRRTKNLLDTQTLATDEISMCTTDLLTLFTMFTI